MNKHEVAEFLEVSTKSVERYVRAGKLKVVYVEGKAVFNEQEVEQLKLEKETPVHRTLPIIETQGLSVSVAPETSMELAPILQQALLVFAEIQQSKNLHLKLSLTLKEAVQISGFTTASILKAAKSGHLAGAKVGGQWRFRPRDIAQFVDSYISRGNFEAKNGRAATNLPNHLPEPTTERN